MLSVIQYGKVHINFFDLFNMGGCLVCAHVTAVLLLIQSTAAFYSFCSSFSISVANGKVHF